MPRKRFKTNVIRTAEHRFLGTRRTHQLPLLYLWGIPPTRKFGGILSHRAHSFGGWPGTHVIGRDDRRGT